MVTGAVGLLRLASESQFCGGRGQGADRSRSRTLLSRFPQLSLPLAPCRVSWENITEVFEYFNLWTLLTTSYTGPCHCTSLQFSLVYCNLRLPLHTTLSPPCSVRTSPTLHCVTRRVISSITVIFFYLQGEKGVPGPKGSEGGSGVKVLMLLFVSLRN